ncbi:MAG TPA: DapH/DapD/GlmU-related protein, partial [Candidatus Eisenbacteria bacterium]|nr:DapH/DapD/GlmU-related protein [Candidatus Eisenbacteria bacterium]
MTRAPGAWVPNLHLDPGAFVAPGAVVVGDVTLGRGASVWFNAVVRGDSAPVEIGEDSNLQDLSVIHEDEGLPARVGARVTIGHRAIIHGCVIEDECLIGMGSILLSGAVIGSGSLIGAGALVLERQVVPPGSLVLGSPGKVVRPVTPAEREGMRGSAAHYAALAVSYRERGFARPHPGADSDTGLSREPGALGFLEWSQLLATLSESPHWVAPRLDRYTAARWAQAPGPGRWSAIEVLCHLRDTDREVLLPRLDRMLAERGPAIAYADMSGWPEARGYRAESARAAHQSWIEARR